MVLLSEEQTLVLASELAVESQVDLGWGMALQGMHAIHGLIVLTQAAIGQSFMVAVQT